MPPSGWSASWSASSAIDNSVRPAVVWHASLALDLLSLLAAVNVLCVWLLPLHWRDFAAFTRSALWWRQGLSPYAVPPDGIVNLNHPLLLPLFALFTVPLGGVLWTALSFVAFSWCVRSTSQAAQLPPRSVAMMWLASGAGLLAFGLGQVTGLLAVPFTVAWLEARRGRLTRAAAWIGLLAALKPFLAVFGLWFLWRREWRAALVSLSSFALTTALGIWLVGMDVFLAWLNALREASWLAHLYNASIWGLMARWFTETPGSGFTPVMIAPRLAWTLAVGASGALMIFGARSLDADVDGAWAQLGLLALLLSPLGWIYYLPIFCGPLTVTLARAPGRVWVIGLACVPPLLLADRQYGSIVSLFVGSWACGSVGALLGVCRAADRMAHAAG